MQYERMEHHSYTKDKNLVHKDKWRQLHEHEDYFMLQMYEKQRVRTSSRGILFPYRPKQKHADARGIGVSGKKRAERGRPTPLGGGGVREERGGSASGGGR